MEAVGISMERLKSMIEKNGFSDISEVFLMCISQGGDLFLEGKKND